MKKTCFLLFLILSFQLALGQEKALLAPTPLLGWNSYNSFGAAVYEEDVKANADYMAEHMKDLGWEYIVVGMIGKSRKTSLS